MNEKITINKKREKDHHYTEVIFTKNTQHLIKVELAVSSFSEGAKTKFTLWLNNKEVYSKILYPILFQRMRYNFTIEDLPCSIKYIWLSGIWYGHIYINGKAVV